MLSKPTEFKYIELNEAGQPIIAGTRFKVRMLAAEHVQYGWSPMELKWQHPHLSLAQIHAAMAYYYDHQAAMDEAMAADEKDIDAIQAAHPNPWTREALLARQKAL
jgi:uncharacterized protein (DUF433 family)